MSARRRSISVGVAIVLVLLIGAAAWAFFTSTGHGVGAAAAGTISSPAPVQATNPSPGVAHVTWSQVTQPSGSASDVTYNVEKSTDASTWVATAGACAGTLTGSATTSCDDSVSTAGDYYYRVTAHFHTWSSQAQMSTPVHVIVCVTATKLVFITSPQTITAGSVSSVITVQRQNASGTPGTCGSTTVDLSTSSGAGSFRDSGNTQTITSVTIPAGSSDASFRYTDTASGAPTITAADHAAVLTQVTQAETVNAGTAISLTLAAATTTPTAGAADNLTITAKDTYGNTATGYTGSKNLSFSGASTIGANNPTVTNSSGTAINFGSTTAITFTNGVATVSVSNNGVMKLYKAQTASIVVSDGSINNGAGLSVTVSAAALNSFTVTTPATQTAGTAFSETITAIDSFGNPASGWTSVSNCVTFTGPANSPNSTAPTYPSPGSCGAGNSSLSFNASGQATASITLYNAASTTLTVTSMTTPSGKTGSTVAFGVNAAPPSTIATVSGSGQSQLVNTAYASPLVAKVTDSYGNPVSGASVTFSGPSSGASVTFGACSSNPQTYSCVVATNSSGQATSSSLTANSSAGAFNVSASASGTNTVNFALTNTIVVSASRIGTATDTTLSSSTSVPSVTTASGKTELILVYRQSSVGAETITGITGPFSGSPSQIAASTGYAANGKTMVYAWQATGNATTGTVTVTFSGNNKNIVTVVDVIQLSNNNTSSAIAQFATATGSSGTATGALTSPAAGDAEIFFVGAGANTTVATPGGFSSLDFNQGSSGQGFGVLSAFNSAAQASTSSTLGASNPWGSIALEIKHA